MSQEPRGRPAPSRGLISDIASWIGGLYMAACGWKTRGDWPAVPKAVIVAAPHTSNWTASHMLAAAYFRIKLGWTGRRA
jgi:1-acyl-sn-glycerol-3-phosphate acyltransferase